MIIDPRHGKGPIVTLQMTKEQAEWAQSGLADVACWINGFKAGLGPDRRDEVPLGLDEIRELNIAIKRAIEAAE